MSRESSEVTTSTAPSVSNFYVRFRTEDDDKDAGDTVSAEVFRDSQVVARHNVFAKPEHKWDDQSDQPASTDPQFGGKAGWFRLDNPGMLATVSKNDRPRLRLRISKTGDSEWHFRTFCLVALSDGTEEEWLSTGQKSLSEDNRDVTFNLG